MVSSIAANMGGLLPAKLSSLKIMSAFCTHLFTGDILQVFLHHDLPEPGFNLTLRQLPFSGPASKHMTRFRTCDVTWLEEAGERSSGAAAAPPRVLTRQRRARASLRGATAGPAWHSTR